MATSTTVVAQPPRYHRVDDLLSCTHVPLAYMCFSCRLSDDVRDVERSLTGIGCSSPGCRRKLTLSAYGVVYILFQHHNAAEWRKHDRLVKSEPIFNTSARAGAHEACLEFPSGFGPLPCQAYVDKPLSHHRHTTTDAQARTASTQRVAYR